MDQQLVQNMIADGYDPSEMKAYMGWDKSPFHHIGDQAMKREVRVSMSAEEDNDKAIKQHKDNTKDMHRPRSYTTTY